MKKFIYIYVLTQLSAVYSAAGATCNDQLIGINIAGPEFSPNRLPGEDNKDYKFPTEQQISYYAKAGFNSIRLPILWERIQPNLFQPLDEEYLNKIKKTTQIALKNNMKVLIDLHNYGRYRTKRIGSPETPNDAFIDVWKRIAVALINEKSVIAYGAMNEPHDMDETWPNLLESTAVELQKTDPNKKIFLPGLYWSSAQKWEMANKQFPIKNIGKNIVYEAHAYFDKRSTGIYKLDDSNLNTSNNVYDHITPFINWLKTRNLKGALGEWGVPANNTNWIESAETVLKLSNQSCLDWFVWAGGAWPPNTELSLEPTNGVEKPLLLYLRKRISEMKNNKALIP